MYNVYVLALVTTCYTLAELGRYLIGSTSKVIARDLHFGDVTCQFNASNLFPTTAVHTKCESIHDLFRCESLEENNTRYCEWNYNGLGMEYQVLAGPAFIAVYTVLGIIMGMFADRINRAKLLSICTCIFSIAVILMGTVKEYWHLFLLRMIMAVGGAGCNPLATGILSDMFPTEQRAFAISIFNWGIIIGYGIAFPVGKYVPDLDLWGLGWRVAYYGPGIAGLVIAVIMWITLKEPTRKVIGEESNTKSDSGNVTLWSTFKQPRMIFLCMAASIRQCGGMTLAYNLDLYFRTYFSDTNLAWWLFAVTTGAGIVGIFFGGIVSDRFVKKMGVKSRVATLAFSQLLATAPGFASILVLHPLLAMIPLGISYFFGVMWYGLTYTVVVEIVPLKIRSTCLGIFLFITNNIGGNLPILVDPISKLIGYREAIMIFYCGAFLIASILFFVTMFMINGPKESSKTVEGHENSAFNGGSSADITLPELNNKIK